MRAALGLARRGLGRVWPNPAVGCVIVSGGTVVGRGRTADGGRPHAEALALAQAGARARGATVYTTLEPCAHTGRTPPCTEALVAAGRGAGRGGGRGPRPAGERRRRRGAPRRRRRGRGRLPRRRGGGAQPRLPHPHDGRPADGDAEDGRLARRAHRHRHRREPLDHRPARARRGAPDARPVRRDPGGRGHGAGATTRSSTCAASGSRTPTRCGWWSAGRCRCRATAIWRRPRARCRSGSATTTTPRRAAARPGSSSAPS